MLMSVSTGPPHTSMLQVSGKSLYLLDTFSVCGPVLLTVKAHVLIAGGSSHNRYAVRYGTEDMLLPIIVFRSNFA
jgi:hypothetical protein